MLSDPSSPLALAVFLLFESAFSQVLATSVPAQVSAHTLLFLPSCRAPATLTFLFPHKLSDSFPPLGFAVLSACIRYLLSSPVGLCYIYFLSKYVPDHRI